MPQLPGGEFAVGEEPSDKHPNDNKNHSDHKSPLNVQYQSCKEDLLSKGQPGEHSTYNKHKSSKYPLNNKVSGCQSLPDNKHPPLQQPLHKHQVDAEHPPSENTIDDKSSSGEHHSSEQNPLCKDLPNERPNDHEHLPGEVPDDNDKLLDDQHLPET